MKKTFFFLLFLLNTINCFAISDITLYNQEKQEILFIIKDNKLYDGYFFYSDEPVDENEFDEYTILGEIIGEDIILKENEMSEEDRVKCKIYEDNNYIFIKISYTVSYEIYKIDYKFYKKNGYLISLETIENDEKELLTYYEDTGFLKQEIYYDDGVFEYNTEYIYANNQNVIKEINYDEEGKLINYIKYIYDDESQKCIESLEYDKKDRLIYRTEYDLTTEEKIFRYEYDEKGKLKIKDEYDIMTGAAIKRYIYNNTNTPDIWTFITFDQNNRYYLEDGYYIEKYSKYRTFNINYQNDTVVNDEENLKYIKKCNFDKSYKEYKYLADKHILVNECIKLCNENTSKQFEFNITKDSKIDFNNCYEITFVKKSEINYKTINKLGKGSGPFGIDIGMTYEEVKAACDGKEPEHISDDRYYFKPIKTHPMFDTYIVWISKKYGVYYIKGISETIKTSEDGAEAKSQFNKLLSILQKKYGTFTKIDKIKDDYTEKDDNQWMQSLKDGARTYLAYKRLYSVEEFGGLQNIYITVNNANSYSTTSAYIFIEYEFINEDVSENFLNDVL